MLRGAVLCTILTAASAARADVGSREACLARLDALHVSYAPVVVVSGRALPGIAIPVEVLGPLGGVTYQADGKPRPLILDCSLVYSLARAGSYFTDVGLVSAVFTDAYDRRNVRGTDRPSNHSFGLALDVHRWQDAAGHVISVEDDYEAGLGHGRDCVGRPHTERAHTLRLVWCRLTRSELFRVILDPDFDDDHRDHFHIDAKPWGVRDDLED